MLLSFRLKVAAGLAVAAGGWMGLTGGPVPSAAADPLAMAKPKAADAKPAAAEKPADTVPVTGTVVGPDGRPVAGAAVYEVWYSDETMSPETRAAGRAIAESAADGSFAGAVAKGGRAWHAVLAAKPGFGVAWVELEYPNRMLPTTPPNPTRPTENLSLRLTADRPVRGRVIDTEGRPVAGATVAVNGVIAPAGDDMDKLLASVRRHGFGMSGQWDKTLLVPPGVGPNPVTTDQDGRFEVRGLGADRVVELVVSGKGIARQGGLVFTRAGVDAGPLNAGSDQFLNRREKGQRPVIYGPEPTLVVEPGYALEGVVTDSGTGRPVAGGRVTVNTGFWDWIGTKTDAAGKYRLDGLAKGMRHHLSVYPPAGSDLMGRFLEAPEGEGFGAVRLDVAVARGAVFAGRVIDRDTGKGVPASFQIRPKGDNPFLAKPEFESAARDMVWKSTNADGTFRLVTVPGVSEVSVFVTPTEKLNDQPFTPYRQQQKMTVDLKPDGSPPRTVELDRGHTAELAAVDGDGKPVAGLVTLGQTAQFDFVVQPNVFKLPAGDTTATVYGLADGETRRVVLVQPERKLGRLILVKPGTKPTAKLYPVQPLAGRLVDAAGRPLAGVAVTVEYDERRLDELVGEHTKFVSAATTDKDGRFSIPDVIPGLGFSLDLRKDDARYVGSPRIGQKIIIPGHPLDLGDRTVERAGP